VRAASKQDRVEPVAAVAVPSIDAEARFVTLCVREPDAVDADEFRATAAAVGDWDAIVRCAALHRAVGYVQQAAARYGVALPAPVESALRTSTVGVTLHLLRLNVELKRVTAALAAAGVPVIVLKGPAIAPGLYATPVLRPYDDLDLVVRPEDEAAAVAALRGSGFVEQRWAAQDLEQARMAQVEELTKKERAFWTADRQSLVELHVDTLRLFLRAAGEAARWQRAVPAPHAPGALMLCPEDQLVQLSVHGHRHGYSRLGWLKDLDVFVRAYAAQLDWELVRASAAEEGVQATVWYSLRLTAALLGTPVPPSALIRLRPAGPLPALYGALWPTTVLGHCPVFFQRRALRELRRQHWALCGVLPRVLLMGRRGERARAWLRLLRRRDDIRRQARALAYQTQECA
jgi:hypothetical protein